jgi:phage terminase large subunit
LDNACWNSTGTDGPTIADEINTVLNENNRTLFGPCVKGRSQMAEQVRLRLTGHEDSEGRQIPGLVFFRTCFHTIRTIPNLTHDKHNPEKVDTTGEDHPYDMVGYGSLSRPYTPQLPEKERPHDRYRRKEKHNKDWMAM